MVKTLSGKFKEVRKSDGTHNLTDIDKLEEGVKEFIRELKDLKVGGKSPEDCSCCKAWLEEIDKLAGDELTGKPINLGGN